MGMLDIIKEASLGAVSATNPTGLFIGEVLSINEEINQVNFDNIIYHVSTNVTELSIKLDQKLTLTREFLILSESITSYKAELKHMHNHVCTDEACSKETDERLGLLSIRTGLKVGDKVILMRIQGAHEYIVLDKVAGNEWR